MNFDLHPGYSKLYLRCAARYFVYAKLHLMYESLDLGFFFVAQDQYRP